MTDLRLSLPFTLILSGSSGCGKSTLVENLLKNREDCFNQPLSEIIWVYAKHTYDKQRFQRLQNSLPIRFHEGFPCDEVDSNNLFTEKGSKLLVLDDVVTELTTNHTLFNLFNVLSHHQNISVIVTVQNLFGCTPVQKSCLSTLLRSCSYLVLFVNRRMVPVVTSIARSYFPGQTHRLLDPFNQLLSESEPYNYLLIDFVTLDETLTVRVGGLTPDQPCYIFRDHEESGGETDEKSEPRARKTASGHTDH